MLFNSFPFLFVYLPLVLAGTYALRAQRPRLLFLVAASYVFYAYVEWWFALLMLASTVIAFTGGLVVGSDRVRRPGLALAASITGLLALLAYFKYAAFLAGYGSDFLTVLTGRGFPSLEELTHGILLPIGISFYTFEGISYVVDVHRRTIPVERDPLRFAFFISFFPHLVAGPIVRYAKLRPQLATLQRFDPDEFRAGLLLFSLGLAKKVLVADGIAAYVNPLLAQPGELGFFTGWAAILGFSFQIYFDFSGYSDMALGLAQMLGIQLPWNFDRPYRAASPIEFWRRWHVTLSSWLRDYLYIPLGGNRKGELRRDANLLATMGLGGLWHGASLTFLVWGLYHGLLLAGTRRLERFAPRLARPLRIAITFFLVTVGWVFFRMATAGDTLDVFAAMAGLQGLGDVPGHLLLRVAVAALIVYSLPEEWRWARSGFGPVRTAAIGALAAVAILSTYASDAFIYFQF